MSVASTFEVRTPVTSCWRCGRAIDSEDRLSPFSKRITSVVVIAISCYVGWKFLIVSREIAQLLAG